jgi:uncharacterized Zn finger protein
MGWYYGFKPYVPVAVRRARAERDANRRIKKGQTILPVKIEGRKIVATFWGQAWCTNLESYSDFENRLPRGRTYVRNGSVVHLEIAKGKIKALVSGSELYTVKIDISGLPKKKWSTLKSLCGGQIGSLVELLQGKLSKAVMEIVTHPEQGLFPNPDEIKMSCSCPDYAGMCKHVAAAMYGIGNRLDSSPELLFVLRAVDHLELIDQAISAKPMEGSSQAPTLAEDELGAIFDIDIACTPTEQPVTKIDKKDVGKKTQSTSSKPPIAKKKKTNRLPKKG